MQLKSLFVCDCCCEFEQYLAPELRSEVRVRVKRGSDVESCRVVTFDARNARLENMASFPELGGLIHVLVEPLVADGEVELLD